MEEENKKDELLHTVKLDQNMMGTLFSKHLIIALVVVALLGVGTGYLLSKTSGVGLGSSATGGVVDSSGSSSTGVIEGSDDLKTFKDIAQGKLEEGGIEGEGQFHLTRPGGISQNVYMTSSVVDLSKYVGKKIKVWGQTQKAQTAAWLMDVGRVEVLK
ncbi:MAG: hypothetical protein AAB907_02075 [Patescibacteria group bacterium]